MAKRTDQTMKPSTAAKKLGVYLPATPQEFQAGPVSRSLLDEWQEKPPQWLTDLRRNGPHPRQVVAARLRVSNSGLTRAGITDALTSADIAEILAEKPEWLIAEQATFEEVRREERRLASERESSREDQP